ncbi:Transposon-encoded protein TnpV [Verrucomicrobium sp. GAS474]|uniref:TnpV protein n=1 Tax=Verrucomicrobium sp. GAS474 TaxID=1882831 RepID=UPI00087B724D|nr:TnpV protein [Verrucomicrobium sp. GAS474]SDT90479.1 Transposon-encoded protein TnpV [Verrucomicrobium sp. GAS474]
MTTTLTQYGRMAEAHWREHLPNKVRELETAGTLEEALLDAEERTKDEMYTLTRHMIGKQGMTVEQAHAAAWEIVRIRYILLPPEAAT